MSGNKVTIGQFLGRYLEHLKIRDYFAIPGDFNLILLDELLKNPNINYVGCCNELNAGYAADGYARAHGISAMVVTYCVGGLSCVNSVAGAYAEDLPMIVISGGPNSNSKPTDELIHHSLGEIRYDFVRKIYAQITAASIVVKHAREAPMQIHDAISICLRTRKPVYIEIACNIVQEEISPPHIPSIEYVTLRSDPHNLAASVEEAAKKLNDAKDPIIVGGVKLRPLCISNGSRECSQFIKFIEESKYAVALMPDAKGLLGDCHPSHIGIYWGDVSLPGLATRDAVELSDMYPSFIMCILFGASFTDYNTCGNTIKLVKSKTIQVLPNMVVIGDEVFPNVSMKDFMELLQTKIKPNETSLKKYKEYLGVFDNLKSGDLGAPLKNFKKKMSDGPGGDITNQYFVSRLQSMILDDTSVEPLPKTVIVETGDAWFSGLKLQLHESHLFEIQMQYGSIGWSVGATFGLAMASAGPKLSKNSYKRDLSKQTRRVVAIIGDGSFQLTLQEVSNVSSIIRYNLNPIIFIVNNHGYTIEEEIHKGVYNTIKNWNYSGLVDVFNAPDDDESGESLGIGRGYKCEKNSQLDEAISKALKYKEGPSLIEIVIDKDDCNTELEHWGACVSKSNSRPPPTPFSQPQNPQS